MPILDGSSFKPAWWLRSGHLQTLWPALWRPAPRPATTRECLPTPDGDFIDLDWHGEASAPIVILVHGLSGSSRSPYIRGMQAALRDRGFRSVAMNFRGCGGRPNRTARCYHSGDTEDLDHLYRHLARAHPRAPLAVVGYSLGGNVVLKWLGERRGEVEVFAAVAVSTPLLLNLCADRMDLGFSRVYRNHMLRELKDYLKTKRDHLLAAGHRSEADKLDRLGDLAPLRSFWEYDDRVIAGLYPFRDVHDYYAKSSSRQYLKSIGAPTLIIHSRDDPFMTPEVIPGADELSETVLLEVTPGGGHVGFIAGNLPGRPDYWLERRIPAFLEERLNRASAPGAFARA